MSINVELAGPELAQLRQITRSDNDSEAVARAARGFIRLNRLRELKAASGRVDVDGDWLRLEEIELAEIDLPK